jgi:hypothetical protein
MPLSGPFAGIGAGGLKEGRHNVRNLVCQEGRDSIAYLLILVCARPFKEVIIRKGLEASDLAHGETAALRRVVMDEVMAVPREV